MADWGELVRQRLSGLVLDASEREDVHAEIAAHLDEFCAALQAEGLPKREAVQRTLEQVTNWHDLGREIAFAKKGEHRMKSRIRQLWIPGFLTMILSTLFLMTFQKLGFQPRPTAFLLYVPWLVSLPFVGALGAFVSSRAGGSRGTVLLASVFPVLALTLAFLLMFPIGFIVERIIGSPVDFSSVATALLLNGIDWLLIPGASLLVGGMLVQRLASSRSSLQLTLIG